MNVSKADRKLKIRKRIRKVSIGTAERPRMSVFRSNKEIYVQLIDDSIGNTLVSASSRGKEISNQKGTKTEIAKLVGKSFAEKAIKEGFDRVSFDRGGNLYHGIVKALAESARESGLKF